MIHTNSITNALYTILSSDQIIVNSAVNVELYTVENGNQNRTPWIGVVPGEMGLDVEYEPARVNIHEPWMAQVSIPLILQSASRSKQAGLQKLDGLQSIVMSAVNCYESGQRTLMSTVDIIIGFSVSPLERGELEGLFFMRRLDIIAQALT